MIKAQVRAGLLVQGLNPPELKLRDDEIHLDEDTNILHERTRYDILAMKLR
jgi:hypothetical protein